MEATAPTVCNTSMGMNIRFIKQQRYRSTACIGGFQGG